MVSMKDHGRFHIPALFSKDFFAAGFTLIPNLLLKYSGRLNLDGTDILVVIAFCYYQQTGKHELEIADFSELLHIPEIQIQESLKKMCSLGLLINSGSSLDPTGLFQKMADLWAEEKLQAIRETPQEITAAVQIRDMSGEDIEELSQPVLNLIKTFEQEFGRPLTPIETAQIESWYRDEGYSEELIKEALKRAVLRGVLNLNYVGRILSQWARKNLRTPREIIQYENEFLSKRHKYKEQGCVERQKTGDRFKDIYIT